MVIVRNLSAGEGYEGNRPMGPVAEGQEAAELSGVHIARVSLRKRHQGEDFALDLRELGRARGSECVQRVLLSENGDDSTDLAAL